MVQRRARRAAVSKLRSVVPDHVTDAQLSACLLSGDAGAMKAEAVATHIAACHSSSSFMRCDI